MAQAKLDQNSRPTLTALSSVGDGSIVPLFADPTTHRLLVDATGGGGSGDMTKAVYDPANGAKQVAFADSVVPYTGATLDVNIGTHDLFAAHIGSTGTRTSKVWTDNLQVTNAPIIDSLTASTVVFSGASKELTSTGIGTSSQFIKGDGSLDSNTYATGGGTATGTNTGDNATNSQYSGLATSKLSLDQTTPQTIANGQPIQGTLTASQLVATDASQKLQTLPVATYPSLTETSYVKGVTSAIQTQLNAKGVGDMVLASTQTVGGLKTFLNGMFKLQNIANTFSTVFSSAATANRTITIPDADMTLARIDAAQTFTGVQTMTKPAINAINPTASTYTPASAATATLDMGVSSQHEIQMPAGNITIAFSNFTLSQVMMITIKQDSVGSRTVTWPTITWAGGTAPTLTTAANKSDVIGIKRMTDGTLQGCVIMANV